MLEWLELPLYELGHVAGWHLADAVVGGRHGGWLRERMGLSIAAWARTNFAV